jgi:hypothetical protein
MAGRTVCPRCGALDSFIKGYLPETCVCLRCQSQLGWEEIPGCGPDCKPVDPGPEECVCPEPGAGEQPAAGAAGPSGGGE